METSLQIEKNHFFRSLSKSTVLILLIVLAFVINDVFTLGWNNYGLEPRSLQKFFGIFTMPFLHGDVEHLFSNSIPLFVLTFGLFYFFRVKSAIILLMTYLLTGIFTWSIGRSGNHIGASGILYGLAFFLVTISLIKQERSLMSFSLIVIFLYGSIVWGFFPQLFPDKNISWEGHLSGAITGILLAWFYRKEGPVKKVYFEEEEEEDEAEDEEPSE
ncbi:MAG TPA: rhomboid family intramembrane serine protease [Bacteroidales bacterium]|nr:rhomboid family intramembrane serine protease [Bacteroidales bacterium]